MNNGHTTSSGVGIRIEGGAGPYHAAVIAAVIEHALAQERRVGSSPDRRFSNWTMVARGEPFMPPRTVVNGSGNGAGRVSAPRRIRSASS